MLKLPGKIVYVYKTLINDYILDFFNSLGVDVKPLKVGQFNNLVVNYFPKSQMTYIIENTCDNDYIYIDDNLTARQKNTIFRISNRKAITRYELYHYYSFIKFLNKDITKALKDEVKTFLGDSHLSFYDTNKAIAYVDSYNNELIDTFIDSLKFGKVKYKNDIVNDLVELYPTITNKLPILTHLGSLNMIFMKNNVIPIDDPKLTREFSKEYSKKNYNTINDLQVYNAEYIFLIRINDFIGTDFEVNEDFLFNLSRAIHYVNMNADTLNAKHLNLIFIASTLEEFKFFYKNNEIFTHHLFQLCGNIKDKLALSLMDYSPDSEPKMVFANVGTYFEQLLLENTSHMHLNIPVSDFYKVKGNLDICRVTFKVLISDHYIIEAYVPNSLVVKLLEYEETDERVY